MLGRPDKIKLIHINLMAGRRIFWREIMEQKYENEEHSLKAGAMVTESIEAFLEKGMTLRLACLKPNGDPFIVPCWHQWEKKEGCTHGKDCGCTFWVVPRARSKWAEYLKNDPRVSACIDDVNTMEKFHFDGKAELVEESVIGGKWVGIAEKMSIRYLGPDGPKYLGPTLNQPRWLFGLIPTRVKTWQGVGWAKSYWVEDTGGATWAEAHSGIS